jgi:hypothetical protein
MDYAETRELVRIRHELRHLLAERPAGADADTQARARARTLIARLEALIAGDTEEAAVVRPELARWQVSLVIAP